MTPFYSWRWLEFVDAVIEMGFVSVCGDTRKLWPNAASERTRDCGFPDHVQIENDPIAGRAAQLAHHGTVCGERHKLEIGAVMKRARFELVGSSALLPRWA
jgi:hypothetical protein